MQKDRPTKSFIQRRHLVAAVAVFVSVFALATLLREGQKDTTPHSVGTPTIGGPFTLLDHTGKTVSDTAFRGRFMLVFFGYTFCPDVCPTNIQAISDAMDLLGRKADGVQPLFVTIDPERDTPAVMADYVGNFHPRLVGLTGTPDDVAKMTKAYRVYFKKAEGVDGDYLMDHSTTTYLMGRDGKFVTHFRHGTDSQVMAEQIRKHL